MNDKRIPLINEEAKHKKKSKKKGQPRADHKHIYEPVLLHHPWEKHTTKEIIIIKTVNMVCQICGRVGECLTGNEWYNTEDKLIGKFRFGTNKLNEKALALPHWWVNDYFDKFAYRKEEE